MRANFSRPHEKKLTTKFYLRFCLVIYIKNIHDKCIGCTSNKVKVKYHSHVNYGLITLCNSPSKK